MATNLTELAQEWLTRAINDRVVAEAGVGQKQAELDAARAAHHAAVAAVADEEAVIEAIRADLAAATTTAEGEALLADLEAVTISHRAKIAAALDAAREADAAEGAVAAARAALTRARGAETLRQAEADKAAARHTAREATKGRVMTDHSGVPGAATTALGSTDHSDAATRVDTAIPNDLRTRARARAGNEAGRVAGAESAAAGLAGALATRLKATHPTLGDLREAEAAFAAADRALTRFSTSASSNLARAGALLSAVAGAEPADPEQASAAADAALAGPGAAAVTAEAARDVKQQEVTAATDAQELAILEALVTDPDSDLTETEVTDAQNALTDAKGELATLETAYGAVKADLDKWEAAVPDSEWRLLEKFDTADRLLTELAAVTPADLVTGATTTETDLVDALVAQDKEARAGAIAEETIAAARARVGTLRSGSAGHGFSRLRGDD